MPGSHYFVEPSKWIKIKRVIFFFYIYVNFHKTIIMINLIDSFLSKLLQIGAFPHCALRKRIVWKVNIVTYLIYVVLIPHFRQEFDFKATESVNVSKLS